MTEPKIRFKQDDGSSFPDWEEIAFDSLYEPLNNNTYSRDCLNYESGKAKNIHYGDILVKFGEICDVQKEKLPFVNDGNAVQKYVSLQDGDIVLADTAEDETVGKAIEMHNVNGENVISGLHTMACRPRLSFAPKYLGYYMNSPSYHSQLKPYMQGIKVTSISRKNIAETMISYPTDEREQQKIADFLNNVNEVIAASEEEVANLEQQKKAVMQKIFSQEVRFKKEDGSDFPDWEEKTFDELYKTFPNKNYQIQTVDYNNTGKYVVIDQGKEYIAGYSDNEEKVCVQYPCIVFGDHTTMVKYVDEPFIVGADGVKTLSTTVLAKYAYYLLDYNNVKPTGYNRHFSQLKELIMDTSVDEKEQQLIADFLTNYDEAITAAKQELAKWKELKKGLLQQMFV